MWLKWGFTSCIMAYWIWSQRVKDFDWMIVLRLLNESHYAIEKVRSWEDDRSWPGVGTSMGTLITLSIYMAWEPDCRSSFIPVKYFIFASLASLIHIDWLMFKICCWCHSDSASVLLYFTFLSHLFPLPCGAGSTVPREVFDSSVIMLFSWCVVAVTFPI